MKIPQLIFLSLLSIASHAFADCGRGSQTIFNCTTNNGKQIELCDAGKTITYTFGKPNLKPELALTVPRTNATTTQWGGVSDEAYSVEIPHGLTLYSVFWGLDHLKNHAVYAGVNITKNNQFIATVNCSTQSKIINHLQGINLKPTH